MTGDRHGGDRSEGESRTTSVGSPEESDGGIVPGKEANKAAATAAESLEERPPAKRNPQREAAVRPQRREAVSIRLERVRQRAEAEPKARFHNLFSLLTVDLLRESFYQLKRQASPGLDKVKWSTYEKNMEANLQDLEDKLHQDRYRATPVRRKYIAKPDGRKRPIGVTTVEDKIVQQAVATLLGAVHEPSFCGFSYGARPGRSAHDALDAVMVALWEQPVGWVLDADIQGFFDQIPHAELLRVLEMRIGDRRLLRLITKWLRVGWVEDGKRHPGKRGTPQGGVISPMLGNIYLDHVLDKWFGAWRRRECQGTAFIVRYVDDVVLGFQYRHEAELALECLRKRLAEWGLTLHPEKTRLIEFGRYASRNRRDRGEGKPESFTFLGVTHSCGKNRKGGFKIRRQTSRRSLAKVLHRIRDQLRWRLHDGLHETGRWLTSVVRGHFQYFAFPDNWQALDSFRNAVRILWFRAIRRRSHKARQRWNWRRFHPLGERYLPHPKLCHPWPSVRFDARTRRRSRMR